MLQHLCWWYANVSGIWNTWVCHAKPHSPSHVCFNTNIVSYAYAFIFRTVTCSYSSAQHQHRTAWSRSWHETFKCPEAACYVDTPFCRCHLSNSFRVVSNNLAGANIGVKLAMCNSHFHPGLSVWGSSCGGRITNHLIQLQSGAQWLIEETHLKWMWITDISRGTFRVNNCWIASHCLLPPLPVGA